MAAVPNEPVRHDGPAVQHESAAAVGETESTPTVSVPTPATGQPPADQPDAEQQCKHNDAVYKLFMRIGEMSSLPSVASRILKVASDDHTGAADLMEVVAGDPGLALRIMRTVNSSYFGLRNPVADLKTAINLLGFRAMRNLALTIHVSRLFEDSGEYNGFTRVGLWNHMVAVASTARLVAGVCGKADPEEAYLAGLLHDVGIILIDQFLRRHFIKILDRVNEGIDTTVAERDELSFDHSELGAFIAQQSNFADQITDAIRYHHTADAYEGPHRPMLDVVTVANYLASRQGISSLGVHNLAPPSDNVYGRLGMKKEQVEEIWTKLEPTLDSAVVLASL